MTPPQVNNSNEFDHDPAFLCIIRNQKTVIGLYICDTVGCEIISHYECKMYSRY